MVKIQIRKNREHLSDMRNFWKVMKKILNWMKTIIIMLKKIKRTSIMIK